MKLFSKDRTRAAWRMFTSRRNAGRYNQRVVAVGHKEFVEPPENETQQEFWANEIRTSKYRWYTFPFKNIFEQFRRIANFYFLIVGVVQLFIDSPVSPVTSLFPLVFVVGVTFVKQGYEDFQRHRADAVINDKLVTRVVNGQHEQIASQKVTVGDVLRIEDGEAFPCDLALLSTSTSTGKANVMTANLDGETNLKVRMAPKETRQCNSAQKIEQLAAQVECESPNADLHRFLGRVKVLDQAGRVNAASLSLENICLRGTHLQNTDFVYGVAVYTGPDTKMSQNSRLTSNKFSSIETKMNWYLIFFLIVLLVEVVICTILKYIFGLNRPGQGGDTPWYFGEDEKLNFKTVSQDFLSFLVLYNYIIPISLYVTLEFQRFFGSFFLTWDLQLYDEETNTPAKCNSTDLNEELGQVEYLFSDKTGTLTQNIMVFKECSIGGVMFSDHDGHLVCEETTDLNEKAIPQFLETLALCHTVQTWKAKGLENSTDPADLNYNASSPDEKAIVEACRNYGVTFVGESDDGSTYELLVTRSSRKKTKVFDRLHVLEFDSFRKCMSVIVRDRKRKEIRLLCKGAETSILPKCKAGPIDQIGRHINGYALIGLRTLAVAVRVLSEEELERFERKLDAAAQSLSDREAKIRAVYAEVEDGLELIGATGVEDKLQDGVRETLIRLGYAGIKVWVLTGDKKETAEIISKSCGHLLPDMRVIDIAGRDVNTISRVMEVELSGVRDQERLCLVVDGATLTAVFLDKEDVEVFRRLADRCQAVICCRMSPLQKAEIVKMIKHSPMKPITASVGDGANDVSMIQEAHVGLGIVGKEGTAAVRAADFAFAKFKHLQRAFLVHGHWYYYRVAILVQYFFYKNVAGFTAQFFYAFFNNFSTQTLYDSVNLTLFNIAFTSLPIFVFGLLEQNISADRLLQDPELYHKIAKNNLLTLREFGFWMIEALWHCIVTFFGFYIFWSGNLNHFTGDDLEMMCFGLAIYQINVVIVNLNLLVKSRHWNGFFVGSILLSVLVFFLCFTLAYHSIRYIDFGSLGYFNNMEIYKTIFNVLASPGIWLASLLLVTTALIPDLTIPALRKSGKGMKEWFRDLNCGRRSYRVGRVSATSRINGDFEMGVNGYDNRAFDQTSEKVFVRA